MSFPERSDGNLRRHFHEESEAGIGAEVPAGDKSEVTGYGPYPLPCGKGFYMMMLIIN